MNNQNVKITWGDSKKTKENTKTKLEEKVEVKQAVSLNKEQPRLQLFFENLEEIDKSKEKEIKAENENKKNKKEKSKINENKSDLVKKDEQIELDKNLTEPVKEGKRQMKKGKILKEQEKVERKEFDNIRIGAKVKAFGVQVSANVNLNRLPKTEEDVRKEIEREQKEFE